MGRSHYHVVLHALKHLGRQLVDAVMVPGEYRLESHIRSGLEKWKIAVSVPTRSTFPSASTFSAGMLNSLNLRDVLVTNSFSDAARTGGNIMIKMAFFDAKPYEIEAFRKWNSDGEIDQSYP